MICSSLKKIACMAMIVCTSCVLTNLVEAQMVEDGLVSYWPLDELQAGKKVPDAFGKNHGELPGESKMKIVAGKVGGAGKFDGTAAVHIPGTKTLELNGTDGMTVSAWVNAKNDEPVKGGVAGCCGTIVAQKETSTVGLSGLMVEMVVKKWNSLLALVGTAMAVSGFQNSNPDNGIILQESLIKKNNYSTSMVRGSWRRNVLVRSKLTAELRQQ